MRALVVAGVAAASAFTAAAEGSDKAKEYALQAYELAAICGKQYAERASASSATATEIAEAAGVACSKELRDAAGAGRGWVGVAMIERGARSDIELDRAGHEAETNVRTSFRGLVLNAVIQARTPRRQ